MSIETNFTYIFGANIKLLVSATIYPPEPEVNVPEPTVEIGGVTLFELDIEIDDISVGGKSLQSLLETAAFESIEETDQS